MQMEKRTAEQWFELWDELAGVRRKMSAQRNELPIGPEREKMTRDVAIADARATLAFIRFLMVKHNFNQSDVLDLIDWLK